MGSMALELSLRMPRDAVRSYLVAAHSDRRFSHPSERLEHGGASVEACLLDQPNAVRVRHATGVVVDCVLASTGTDDTRVRLEVEWTWKVLRTREHRHALVDLAQRLLGVEYGYLTAIDRRRPPYR